MSQITLDLTADDFAKDAAAVAAVNFCSLWPAAKQALQALIGVVTNPVVKFAVNTVLAAGDAYCGTQSSSARSANKAAIVNQLSAAGVNSLDDLATLVLSKQQGGGTAAGTIIYSEIVITQ